MRIVLSNLQLALLEIAAHADHISIEQAQHFSQVTFGSALREKNKWLAYRPGRGFVLTKKGRAARAGMYEADITRKNVNGPLTRFFDPTAYGLEPRKKREPKAKKEPGKDGNVREFLSKSA